MPVIVIEPHDEPRRFKTLGHAKAYMKKKAQAQMEFCRKYANDSIGNVADLLSSIESLDGRSFEDGPVRMQSCVDSYTGSWMRFQIEATE